MCIFGFLYLYYAKDLFKNSPTVKFVPYLHNNTRTLESQNSVIRAIETQHKEWKKLSLPVIIFWYESDTNYIILKG